jgi:SHS2 domain-containing protein
MSRQTEGEEVPARARRGYFDHDADVGIYGRGVSAEAAFIAAAESTFDLMTDISLIQPSEHVDVDFEEPELDFALVTWLNALLALAHERGLALGRFELQRSGTHWRGAAWGEPWREDLPRGVDVKGATLTALSVFATSDGWEARCVVDV